MTCSLQSKEADGSEQLLVVPFASLPVLQREGRLKYSATSGQYRSYDGSVDKTSFGQGTAIYGLPRGFTAYGGGQFASKYQSVALGVGKTSVTLGHFLPTLPRRGQRCKTGQRQWPVVAYPLQQNIVQTGTNFAIAGYRYSTDGYYSLQEVLDTYRDRQFSMPLNERKRNRTELTMTQSLWQGAGSLSLSLVTEDYWNSDRTMRSIGTGYSNSWNGISYGLNYSYNENASASNGSGKVYDRDQVFAFNVSIPLDRWLKNTYASYNVNSSQQGGPPTRWASTVRHLRTTT